MTTTTINRKSANKVTTTVSIICRYLLKMSGFICYKVTNSEGRLHCVTLSTTGSWACMSEDNQPCNEAKYKKSHLCKHIEACQKHEQRYYQNGILIDIQPEASVLVEADRVLANAQVELDGPMAQDAHGPTKWEAYAASLDQQEEVEVTYMVGNIECRATIRAFRLANGYLEDDRNGRNPIVSIERRKEKQARSCINCGSLTADYRCYSCSK